MKNKMLWINVSVMLFAGSAGCADEWNLVWHDEFDQAGPPDPANWDYERGFVRNEEPQWYQPQNAFCTNGLLVIEARPEHKPNPHFVKDSKDWRTNREWIDYTSASLTSRGLHEFKYGKFEMRARIVTSFGSWPAFWTLGVDRTNLGWPACGEIDIMEFYTGNVLANIDYRLNNESKWSTVKKPVAQFAPNWSNEFHIWTMEWDAQKIDLLLDGTLMNHLEVASADQADLGNPFHRPVFLILNQALRPAEVDPAHTKLPMRFEVDWVRAYQH